MVSSSLYSFDDAGTVEASHGGRVAVVCWGMVVVIALLSLVSTTSPNATVFLSTVSSSMLDQIQLSQVGRLSEQLSLALLPPRF